MNHLLSIGLVKAIPERISSIIENKVLARRLETIFPDNLPEVPNPNDKSEGTSREVVLKPMKALKITSKRRTALSPEPRSDHQITCEKSRNANLSDYRKPKSQRPVINQKTVPKPPILKNLKPKLELNISSMNKSPQLGVPFKLPKFRK